MNSENQALLKFLQWFCTQDFVPLQTRRDLVAHLQNQKQLDQKTVDYISQVMNSQAAEAKKSQQWHDELQTTLDDFIAAEKNPEVSLKITLKTEATEEITNLAEDFTSEVKAFNQSQNQSQETKTQTLEQDEVAAIKNSLGA